MTDVFLSATVPISLICGEIRVIFKDEGKPDKILSAELNMHRVCANKLLPIIQELTAELCKTATGYKAAIKILSGRTCLVVLDEEKKINICSDEIAKVLRQYESVYHPKDEEKKGGTKDGTGKE